MWLQGGKPRFVVRLIGRSARKPTVFAIRRWEMRVTTVIIMLLTLAILTAGCSSGDSTPPPVTGKLRGGVVDIAGGTPIAGVRVVVYDANSNNPVATYSTAAGGMFEAELPAGSYFLRCSKQGYEETPPREISPLPLATTPGQTTSTTVQMPASVVVSAGAISGSVTNAGKGVSNVLVVVKSGANGYSGVTDASGAYAIYNIPASQCTVKAWTSALVSNQVQVSLGAGVEAVNTNLTLSTGTTGTVTGSITFLATTNIEVDVALLNPLTRQAIPGLSVTTQNTDFAITGVAPGTYLARATYRNDGKVVDPDWIVKNGDPMVTVTGGTVSRPFSLTGAIELLSPTNGASSAQPVDVAGTLPTFTWEAYSSADHYVPEVINQSGKVIWGGFSSDWAVRRVLLPKTQTSIRFNADSTATESLVPGRTYRWKVYVSKDDAKEPLGWKLISVSEDQRGLIKILP